MIQEAHITGAEQLAFDLERADGSQNNIEYQQVADDLAADGYLKIDKENTELRERIARQIHEFSQYDTTEPQPDWGTEGCGFCRSRAGIVIDAMLGKVEDEEDGS